MNKSARFSLVTTAITVGTLYAGAWRAEADFIQTNLVSDIPGLAALTDPALHNPWGMSHTDTSPIWTSNQATQTATLFAVTPDNNVSKVTAVNPPAGNIAIPPMATGGPTGQGRQYESEHLVLPGRERRQWWVRSLHLCQFERHHLRLGYRPDSLYPSDDPRC
jgi:hypothetical protein